MKLQLSMTLVFFLITGILCKPGYQSYSEDAIRNEPEEKTPITDKVDTMKLEINNNSEDRLDMADEVHQSTPFPVTEYPQFPLEDGSLGEPERIEPIGEQNRPLTGAEAYAIKSIEDRDGAQFDQQFPLEDRRLGGLEIEPIGERKRPPTAAELYAIKSIGDRVAAWTPQSGLNADELANDMIPPVLGGAVHSPTIEQSEYKLENILEITPDVILIVGKKMNPQDREMYLGQSHNQIRVHDLNGMPDNTQTLVIDKVYGRASEYRIHPGMSNNNIQIVDPHVPQYPPIVDPYEYRGHPQIRYQNQFPDQMSGRRYFDTRTSRKFPNADEYRGNFVH